MEGLEVDRATGGESKGGGNSGSREDVLSIYICAKYTAELKWGRFKAAA